MKSDFVVIDEYESYDSEEDDIVFHENTRIFLRSESDEKVKLSLLRKIEHLTQRNSVLCTLCGLHVDIHVINSAILIQSYFRGWVLRRDKSIFDHHLSFFINQCKMVVKRNQFLRTKMYCSFIQAHVRGYIQRKSPICISMKRLLECKREIFDLELLLLANSRNLFMN